MGEKFTDFYVCMYTKPQLLIPKRLTVKFEKIVEQLCPLQCVEGDVAQEEESLL